MTLTITVRVLAVALLAAAVAACSSDPAPREVAGTLVSPNPAAIPEPGPPMAGAPAAVAAAPGAPAMPGARAAAPPSSAVIGSMIGPRIGAALDDEDKRRAYAAQVQALESGTSGAPVAWRNPDSGRYGSVVPGQKYQSANGADCRRFTHTIYLDGKPQTARGAACRAPDGNWQAG